MTHLDSYVTLLPSIFDASTFEVMPLREALERLTNEWRDEVERVRTLTGKAQKRAKERLPAFAFSGAFKRRVVNDDLDVHSAVVIIDYDDVGDPWQFIRYTVEPNPHALAAWPSARGEGVKVLIALDKRPKTNAEHRMAFAQVCRHLDVTAQEESQHDVRRLCFVSAPDRIWINDSVVPFEVDLSEEAKPQRAHPVGDVIPHGTQHNMLVSLAGSMRRRGMNGDEIFPALWEVNKRCEKPGTEKAIRKIADSMMQYEPTATPEPADGPALTDFYWLATDNKCIFAPTGELWPNASADRRLPAVPTGQMKKGSPEPETIPASLWLASSRPVEQQTWAPGEPQIIEDILVAGAGQIPKPGVRVFNLYKPPILKLGSADKAGRWTEHLREIYPDDADHITAWCASKVQRPGVKVNHALVLGGAPGIGKDTLLEALKRAVGGHNFGDATPTEVVSRFNGFLKTVVLRISEARDMGDVDRYGLYEHLKIITAAPPDVLRIDEKHTREFYIQNVVGIVYTTNHKSSGIYLPADDRRHYVAWSEATQSDFPESYWRDYYRWYESGGYGHVAAYLHEYDLSGFDPKAPPKKTTAFWEIVDANQAPEDAELADALDALDWPEAVTLQMVREKASVGFEEWLADRRNARKVPHRFEAAGYVPVRNEGAKDGRFKVEGKRQTIYARKDMGTRDRIIAAEELTTRLTIPF